MSFAMVLVILIVVGVLDVTHTTSFFRKPVPITQVVIKAGKPAAKPQNNASAATITPAAKTPTSNTGNVISGGTDTNGNATSTTNSSQWVVAASGNITVKQPVANATLQPGGVLSGSAKVSQVNFRLIDNSVGVVSEGTLSVVNGNFSGNLNFTPHSSSGRLDVFSTNAQGVELNEVQISVDF